MELKNTLGFVSYTHIRLFIQKHVVAVFIIALSFFDLYVRE